MGAGGGLGRNYSYKRCLGGFNKNGYNLFRSHPLLYSCYEYKYLKVLRQTIYEEHLSLNCLAYHLEKDFTLSKQLVTVGLLVPAQYQLSNPCISNRCALHLNSHDYIIQYMLSYTVYGSIFLNNLRFDAYSLYSCRYSLMICILKPVALAIIFCMCTYVIVY